MKSQDYLLNHYDKNCPKCSQLMLARAINEEGSKPNPYMKNGKGCGEFTFSYIWFWCECCLYTEKDIPF